MVRQMVPHHLCLQTVQNVLNTFSFVQHLGVESDDDLLHRVIMLFLMSRDTDCIFHEIYVIIIPVFVMHMIDVEDQDQTLSGYHFIQNLIIINIVFEYPMSSQIEKHR